MFCKNIPVRLTCFFVFSLFSIIVLPASAISIDGGPYSFENINSDTKNMAVDLLNILEINVNAWAVEIDENGDFEAAKVYLDSMTGEAFFSKLKEHTSEIENGFGNRFRGFEPYENHFPPGWINDEVVSEATQAAYYLSQIQTVFYEAQVIAEKNHGALGFVRNFAQGFFDPVDGILSLFGADEESKQLKILFKRVEQHAEAYGGELDKIRNKINELAQSSYRALEKDEIFRASKVRKSSENNGNYTVWFIGLVIIGTAILLLMKKMKRTKL